MVLLATTTLRSNYFPVSLQATLRLQLI